MREDLDTDVDLGQGVWSAGACLDQAAAGALEDEVGCIYVVGRDFGRARGGLPLPHREASRQRSAARAPDADRYRPLGPCDYQITPSIEIPSACCPNILDTARAFKHQARIQCLKEKLRGVHT